MFWLVVFRDSYLLGWLMILSGIMAVWGYHQKKIVLIFIAILVMAGLQFKATMPRSLTSLSNDEQRVVELGKSAYPPIEWAPIAYWLEEKRIMIASRRWGESLFENLDPNQYFFAFHPRERVGFIEIEKLPFWLLPFALLGLWRLGQEKLGQMILGATFFWLTILALIGNQSPWGGLATWPMWMLAIYKGIWSKRS